MEYFYSKKQVAERLGVHPLTVHRMIKAGTIKAIKLGTAQNSAVRIPATELERLLAGQG
jgi:excisionase family DNA binding protein